MTAPTILTRPQDYDVLAPVYDDLGGAGAHGRWLARIERLALDHGLRGRRVLDVACGTGSSFLALLARGYAVAACDASPRMAACAQAKAGPAARVLVADMRRLPSLGRFDLVSCLDDGAWDRRQMRRRQRHYPMSSIAGLLEAAGCASSRLVASAAAACSPRRSTSGATARRSSSPPTRERRDHMYWGP